MKEGKDLPQKASLQKKKKGMALPLISGEGETVKGKRRARELARGELNERGDLSNI